MARRWVNIKRRSSGEVLLQGVAWADSFGARLRGLMFRRALRPGEALVLVEPREGRTATSIHMFFVPFAIAAVWLDTNGRVVDKVEALPWHPYYAPRAPARYTLEAAPEFLDKVNLDEELVFEDCLSPVAG